MQLVYGANFNENDDLLFSSGNLFGPSSHLKSLGLSNNNIAWIHPEAISSAHTILLKNNSLHQLPCFVYHHQHIHFMYENITTCGKDN